MITIPKTSNLIFCFIPILFCLNSCSSTPLDWPPSIDNAEIFIIGPVYDPSENGSYRYPRLLNQAISELISDQGRSPFRQEPGKTLQIRHINWLLHQKEILKNWKRIYQDSKSNPGSISNSELTKIIRILHQEAEEEEETYKNGNYFLIIRLVPPSSTTPEQLQLEGYRLVFFSIDELDANLFQISVNIKNKKPVAELKKTLQSLIFTGDLSSPSFGTMGFSLVKGGCYHIGDSKSRETCVDDFYLAKFPVTQNQWKQVMTYNPSLNKTDGRLPVDNVSWTDTQVFMDKLADLTGFEYRLPTEQEWEYACRNRGTNNRYGTSSGKISHDQANYFGMATTDKWSGSSPTGAFPANQLGLFDMSGNVWEWMQNHYSGDSDQGVFSRFLNKILSRNDNRVIRGGSFDSNPNELGCLYRKYAGSSIRSADIGFRLILE